MNGFKVGDKVRDIDVIDNGVVTEVTDYSVTVLWSRNTKHTFDHCDIKYLAKGWKE